MSKQTTKKLSEKDAGQVLQGIYNPAGTISVDGFVSSKVGAKLTRTAVSSSIDDFRYLDVFCEETVSVSSSSAVIQFTDELNQLLSAGQYLFGADIPKNTTVLSFDREAKTITMSADATGDSSSEDLKIANLLQRMRVTYDGSTHDNVDDVERLD